MKDLAPLLVTAGLILSWFALKFLASWVQHHVTLSGLDRKFKSDLALIEHLNQEGGRGVCYSCRGTGRKTLVSYSRISPGSLPEFAEGPCPRCLGEGEIEYHPAIKLS